MNLFRLGKDKDTGKILEITEVEGGLDCNCICPHCDKDLVAAQGAKTEWYFRHHESTDCDAVPEKVIQALAKEILAANSRIKLPSVGVIKYENIEADKKPDFLSFSSDFLVKSEGEYLYFKIKVNKEARNKKAYPENDYNSIEIDLTDYVFTSKNDFRKDLLNKVSHKKIISWQDKSSKFWGGNKIIPTVVGLFGAGVIVGVLAVSENIKNRNKATERNFLKRQTLLKTYENILDSISKTL